MDRVAQPTPSDSLADKPIEKSGGFGLCARLIRKDGTPVDGITWKFFNNWPNRVRMVEYDIGRHPSKEVIDLTTLPKS